MIESKEIELNADDSKALEALIRNIGFFALPTDDHVHGFDGDEWILEGVLQGQYHVVARWCPTLENPKTRGLIPFIAFSKFLIDKSALSQRPTDLN